MPVADCDGVVEVLIDGDAAAFHRASPALFVDLQDHIVEFDGVIPVNDPLTLDREHAVQIGAVAGNKSRSQGFSGLDRELFVELADIASFQKTVGFARHGQTTEAQFLR